MKKTPICRHSINDKNIFIMELVFKESEKIYGDKPAYEVEFTATSDFNLHIERKS